MSCNQGRLLQSRLYLISQLGFFEASERVLAMLCKSVLRVSVALRLMST